MKFRATIWGLVLLALLLPVLAWRQPRPNHVYAYNGNRGGYDGNAMGYVWHQMGFIDATDGTVATEEANGDVMLKGQKVGSAIKNANGQTIGYRNADGTREAYDLDRGATLNGNCWNRVSGTGTLEIVKHGSRAANQPQPGGGVHVDGGRTFAGFGPTGGGGGTGVPFPAGPYPLDPRPGDTITVKVHSCWSDRDPDPDNPDVRSVTDSVRGIPGVAGATGVTGTADINMGGGFTKGNAAQRRAAREILFKAAKDAGFHAEDGSVTWDHVFEWIASLPFPDRMRTVNDLIRDTGAAFGVTYQKRNLDPGLPSNCTAMFVPGFPLSVGFYGLQSVGASVFCSPFSSTFERMYMISKLPAPPLDFFPPGGRLTSGVFDLRDEPFNPPLAEPLTHLIRVEGNPRVIRPFYFDTELSMWMPLSNYQIQNGILLADVFGQGIVACYEITRPCPLLNIVATEGQIRDPGDVTGPDETELLASSVTTPRVSEPNLTTLAATYQYLPQGGPLFDVRIMARISRQVGSLRVAALDVQSGQFVPIGTMATAQAHAVFRAYDLPASRFVQQGVVRLQIKSVVSETLQTPTFFTWIDWIEVASHQ